MIKSTVVAALLIVAVAASAYFWYFGPAKEPANPETSQEQNKDITEFRKLLAGLKTIKLDTAFFSDPVYKSLIDPDVVISKPPNYGRANPFVPVAGGAVVLPKR